MKLRVKLQPGWRDFSAENPDGPPTYIREISESSGAFQISWAEYRGGKVPSPSLDQLRLMCEDFGVQNKLGELVKSESGSCDFGTFGTAVFRSAETPRFQVWTISDGKSFIRATHICTVDADMTEVLEASVIAKQLTLAE